MLRKDTNDLGLAFIGQCDAALNAVGILIVVLTTMMPKQLAAILGDAPGSAYISMIDPEDVKNLEDALKAAEDAKEQADEDARAAAAVAASEAAKNATLGDALAKIAAERDVVIADRTKANGAAERAAAELARTESALQDAQAARDTAEAGKIAAKDQAKIIAIQLAAQSATSAKLSKALSEAEADRESLTRTKRELDDQATTRLVQTRRIEELEGEIRLVSKRQELMEAGQPFDLDVRIDLTKSMADPAKQLANAIRFLVELMPRVCPSFRIRVSGYRTEIVMDTGWLTVTQDKGTHANAIKAVDDVLSRHTNVSSLSDVEKVIRASMTEFDRAPISSDRRQILALICDVGPFEMDKTMGASEAEIVSAKRLIVDVATWANSSTDRRIMALYADSSFTAKDTSRAASIGFFERLGTSNGKSVFCMDSSQLLSALLDACFAPKGRTKASHRGRIENPHLVLQPQTRPAPRVVLDDNFLELADAKIREEERQRSIATEQSAYQRAVDRWNNLNSANGKYLDRTK